MNGKGEKRIYILKDEPKSFISNFARKEERERVVDEKEISNIYFKTNHHPGDTSQMNFRERDFKKPLLG